MKRTIHHPDGRREELEGTAEEFWTLEHGTPPTTDKPVTINITGAEVGDEAKRLADYLARLPRQSLSRASARG